MRNSDEIEIDDWSPAPCTAEDTAVRLYGASRMLLEQEFPKNRIMLSVGWKIQSRGNFWRGSVSGQPAVLELDPVGSFSF
jgi:hypothetical protein